MGDPINPQEAARNERPSTGFSFTDTFAISETLSRLCNHSVTNITIPRFDAYKDVHDFIGQFERITSNLNDEQKLLVLPKAFPVDCYQSWYGIELAPLVKSRAHWSVVKDKIIKRFSVTGIEDKHFARLRELKYDPDGSQSLLGFIEDLLYSYERVYPNDTPGNAIKYIKLTLPPSLKAKLNLYSQFKDATDVDMVKSAVKDYDLARGSSPKKERQRESTQELANIIKELVDSVKKESQAIRAENLALRQEVAAIVQSRGEQYSNQSQQQQHRSRSPVRTNNYYRQGSPGRDQYRSPQRQQGYYANRNQNNRQPSPYDQSRGQSVQTPASHDGNPDGKRPTSPANYHQGDHRNYNNRPPTPYKQPNQQDESVKPADPFDAKEYFARFGQPPSALRAPVSANNVVNGVIKSLPGLLYAYFEFSGELLPVIIDTGATISVIPENGRLMTQLKPQMSAANVNVTLGDNSTTHIDKKVFLPVRPKGSQDSAQLSVFYVQNGATQILGSEALIGLKTLKQFPIVIQFVRQTAQVFCHGKQIGQEVLTQSDIRGSISVNNSHLSATTDISISRLLGRYKSVFTDIGQEPLRGQPMRILTTHNRPIFAKQGHYNYDEVLQMKKHILGLLEKGIIENTYSGYAAKSRIIPKRSGSGRLVVNYMPLNAVTLRDSYCLPHVSDILGALQGKKYFSALDCSQGFYQILVDQRDRHKTAFSTPVGNFQFVRCPFGARNSCAMFQSEMNRIFRDGLYTKCVIYVDDILVLGETKEEHDANLEWVLQRCKAFNVKLKLEKCKFAQVEVDYLGFRVSGHSISPLKDRIETLREDKPPRSKLELRSVIGKLNFYSRFVKNYSKLLEPFRELHKKNKDFQWLPHHQKVYEQILKYLNDAEPQRMIPRSALKYIELHIMKDSIEVLCLTQENELICRASRFITATEANYSTVEKQLLALTLAINKFRLWLDPDNFIVRVSSKGIARAMELVDRPERIENLLMRMPDGFDTFKFEVNEGLTNEIAAKYKLHIPQEIYFIDGACKGNGKPDCKASWAVVTEYDENLNECGFVQQVPSNQTAELTAAIKACEIAKQRGQTEITIVTDSKYLHSAATDWTDRWKANDWKDHRNKPVIHTELFKQLLNAKTGIQIEWIHVKGHSGVPGNVRADSLARSLLDEQEECLNVLSRTDTIQADDPEVDAVKEEIELNLRPNHIIDNGIVYYVDPRIEVGDPRRMYVPKNPRGWMLSLAHDNHLYGGHLGIKNTLLKLSRFWWPGMRADVESYVKSCHVCQSFKDRTGLPPGYLHSIPVSRIFQHLHLDIVGPTVSSTERGNRYIITATDAFSKYAFAKPVQSITTEDLIKFMEENVLFVHGRPEVIITDRGAQFTSKQWSQFMEARSIKHQLTSPYHPQSNGIDERLNGTLVRILRTYVDQFQELWDKRLPHALYVYNNTVNRSTGFSPYHIMYGLDPRSPFNQHVSSDCSIEELGDIRNFVRELADETNSKSQEAQKREYDRRHGEFKLKVGQFVWVREHTCPRDVSKKFYPKWYGPCVITSLIGDKDNPRAVAILDPDTKKTSVKAIQDVKLHYDRPKHLLNNVKKSKEEGDMPTDSRIESIDPLPLIDFDYIPTSTDTSTLNSSSRTHESPNEELATNKNQTIVVHTQDFHAPPCESPRPSYGSDRISFGELGHDNPMSSSRRVTFSDTLDIAPPDASSIISEGDEQDSTVEDDESTFQPVPDKNNPYVMDFIIDNPVTDRDFDPALQSDAESRDSIQVQPASNTGPGQQVLQRTTTNRYNLRSRGPAYNPPANANDGRDRVSHSSEGVDLIDLSAENCNNEPDNDDLVPPDVTDLDEETLLDINALMAVCLGSSS